jgi:cytochrome d ubiquinol oxidase subunit I
MAFFLEATFIGLFFFGWDKLSRIKHLIVTFLLALGTNFSALWILIANAWMQNPVGSEFNLDTMRMEITDFSAVIFNPVAQSKFVHTVSAGYVLGAMFVLSISAWYLLRGRNADFAKRSMTVAASFGLAASLSVVVLGDESGYTVSENQKMKLAAIEAMWETEPPPASFTAFGFPDVKERTTHLAIHIPWVMGLIGTRSIDGVMPGINQLVEEAETRIASGVKAYVAMQALRKNRDDAAARAEFEQHKGDLGYALLLRRVMEDPASASSTQIKEAADSTIPNVPVLFWSFRIMVGCGIYFIVLFAYSFWLASVRELDKRRWYLKLALWSLPLPWLAIELGWIVAEYGRQPWAIEGVLPTALGVSSVSASQVATSLAGFVLFYTALAVVDAILMVRYTKKGPDGLGMWPESPARPVLAAAHQE